jgi:asparagine N-glycosylation enzyme membrane subunit Stt3
MKNLRQVTDVFIYASVALGVILLLQLWFLVPMWLFYSVALGWIAYFITAVAIMRRHEVAYKAALILAILTLAVSVPQPEHYAFVSEGVNLASMTFVLGSLLQLCIIVLLTTYFLRSRK